MGLGVEPDSTFAGLLANSQTSECVLNCSWVGYSSADYLNVARGILNRREGELPFRVRHVTVFWCLNDVYSRFDWGGDPGQQVRVIGGGVLTILRSHLRAYQWLKATLTDRPRAYYAHDSQFYGTDARFLASALSDLDSISILCRNDSIKFEVVMLPYEYQLRGGRGVGGGPQLTLRKSLEAKGIRTLDLMECEVFWRGDPSDLFRYGDGIHFGCRGHRAVYVSLRAMLR
jgi:hypothetical protein